ncbi:MAG: hypothetical protein JG781_2515 [Peptococcaceae bacterium]|jgi:type III secretory pathway lipoprotein EscJ|nr:hypothetical protein [Peptococcaceae bacterium]
MTLEHSQEWVYLTNVYNQKEAAIVCDFLLQNGITAKKLFPGEGEMTEEEGRPKSGVNLYVSKENLAEARELLQIKEQKVSTLDKSSLFFWIVAIPGLILFLWLAFTLITKLMTK